MLKQKFACLWLLLLIAIMLAAPDFLLAQSGISGNEVMPYETYQTYFGLLHSHSECSDGTGTPLEAYQYARDQGKLDFFSLADHSEFLFALSGTQNGWAKVKAAAEAVYAPGSFVSLWGFEWSNPINGHITIINTDDFTDCIANFGLPQLYAWLAARPEGFAFYNHPGDYNQTTKVEFAHFDMLDTRVIPQMVGVETWNGSHGFDEYFYQNIWKGCNTSYLDTGEQKGWYLGALGNQDNHDRNWGTMNQFRTAVLAKSLTREAIVEAYRARRFYATEDSDLILDFRCQGYPMGSRLTGVARNFTVNAVDRSGDTFAEIRLYRNGVLLAMQPVSGNQVSAGFTDAPTAGKAYYYVMVKENDDNDKNGRNDEALASPIWIE